MKKEVQQVIEGFQEKLNEHLKEAVNLKKLINDLSVNSGGEVMYEDVELENTKSLSLKPDEYYTMPLATAVKEYLKKRNRAVKIDEIVNALKRGGFDFRKTKFAERNTKITLTKNPAFRYISGSESFGLVEWYPNKKEIKVKSKKDKKDNSDTLEFEEDEQQNTEEETSGNEKESGNNK